uniref:IQ calmodulin-binding motif family protein n=1 Tax=Oryza sativa subsp. japonica TaxID=39947 RepID=Q109U0_ORYSJ|nr:IQ calmodulin-binding motif family protein [Oryza sativa Japonica Group]
MLGSTKVFLRAGQITILNMRHAEVLENAARHIQGRFRTFITRKEFVKTREASISIQSYCRGCLARKMYMVKREMAAAIIVQKYVRRWRLHRTYQQAHSAALLIQSCIRGFIARRYFSVIREQRAALVIQAANEADALREAKNKLEKKLDDLTLRLTLERRLRVAKRFDFGQNQTTSNLTKFI